MCPKITERQKKKKKVSSSCKLKIINLWKNSVNSSTRPTRWEGAKNADLNSEELVWPRDSPPEHFPKRERLIGHRMTLEILWTAEAIHFDGRRSFYQQMEHG